MKHRMGQRCDVKLLGSARGSRACFGGLAENFLGLPQLMSFRTEVRDRGGNQSSLFARTRIASTRAACAPQMSVRVAHRATATVESLQSIATADLVRTCIMAANRKPNLILFLPDQQRADTLACYGGVKVHAPNLNKLASESVIFERTYVTHPVCTPSRSSLMTGTWPHINGCTHNSVPLDRRFRVFPELMQDQDYRTAYIGKWHLGEDGPAGRGFQHWISTDDQGDYTGY